MDNRRFPLYERLIEGYMTKRFFMAYDNLAAELARQNAVSMLKIPQKEAAYRTYDFMMQFHADVTEMIKTRPGFQNYDTLYDQFQEQVIKNVNNNFYQRIKNSITNPEINAIFKDKERLRQVLFNPKNTNEKEIARAIWNMQNPANLYKDEHLAKMAKHALDELHGETNLDDFEIYMRAAKVLMGSKRPEMLM